MVKITTIIYKESLMTLVDPYKKKKNTIKRDETAKILRNPGTIKMRECKPRKISFTDAGNTKKMHNKNKRFRKY